MAAPTPTIIYTNGVYTLPPSTTAGIFETFNGAVAGAAFTPNPKVIASPSAGTVTETASGTVTTQTGTVPGAVNPDNNGDGYLAVQNGTFTVSFGSAGVQFFSFVFGTLDTYNSLTLNFKDGTSVLYQGQQIIGLSGLTTGGTQTYTPQQTGRVSYDTGGGSAIVSAIFGSTQAAFEIDDIAAAAPEPATWALMILGFGLAGAQLRYSRRKGQIAFA
ncbi:PEPxxWA-CTERM sorting domain-containing protein [uncultured Sphingomonas sp.]|uniref:PEPxxWA-CTERM sorting domain-containing protein n=1 Tax=uncultured Sphingomonas sp. TaxID=158754 RepID=UPI0035C9FDCF